MNEREYDHIHNIYLCARIIGEISEIFPSLSKRTQISASGDIIKLAELILEYTEKLETDVEKGALSECP